MPKDAPAAPETPEGLLARLAALGIAARTVRHAPVFTVAESRALRGALPGAHTKNLFLAPARGEGPFLLVTLEEERRVSINALARALGAPRLVMGSAAQLLAALGVPPGSVTPLALVNARPGSVRFAIERALVEGPELVWVHPLTNAASTGLRPADLLGFLRHLGHAPEVFDPPPAAGAA
ncbi:prolyl-tRNA synthetase associated domain-containing protein [Caldovatus aquaticus]|uniref:Prolyl-tRNA synthetase associated domain-containing protein n=1 Tax=Caldovatus aquaticus TaxID=2865671 RepID=A0ABS7F0X8_9PROT|nr:prolyl-tRNA synthetase associated domain-containing protein [Caldovatus aquaticus]MBW8269149.1 prolyl-tRNA synthetase associated domain-containing protein [Caldovatus aquaticus]